MVEKTYQAHVDILMISTEPLYHTELNPTEHDINVSNEVIA